MLFPLQAVRVERASSSQDRGPVLFKLRQYGHEGKSHPWMIIHCPSSDRASSPFPADVCTQVIAEDDGVHMSLGLFLNLAARTPIGITSIVLGDKSAVRTFDHRVVDLLFRDRTLFASRDQVAKFTDQLNGLFPYIDKNNDRSRWADLYWEVFFASRAFRAWESGNEFSKLQLSRQVERWVDPLYRDKMFVAWPEEHEALNNIALSAPNSRYTDINRLYRDIIYLNPIEFT